VRAVGVIAALEVLVGCGGQGGLGGGGGGAADPGGGAAGGGEPDNTATNDGTCNSLTASGPMITDEKSTSLPALGGGALADGTYTLTKYEWFDNQMVLHMRRIVMAISNSGRTVQWLWQRDKEPDERRTVTVFTSGSNISMRASCPSGADLEWDRYGSDGTTLVLFSTRDSKAATLTRQ
jgi:hypothetical protein